MNRRLIIRVLGAILLVEAAAMLPALIVSLIYGDGDTAVMGLSILIVSFVGTVLLMLPPPFPGSHLRLKEGFIVTALGWILMSLCGALPFFISGIYPRFEDAFFEAVSGFITSLIRRISTFIGFHLSEEYGSRRSRTDILYPSLASILACFSYSSFFGSEITKLGFPLLLARTAIF